MRTRHLDFPRRSAYLSVVIRNLMRYEKAMDKNHKEKRQGGK
jgi:hypothetical protein